MSTIATSLDFVGDTTPYNYLGDSHALISTLMFRDAVSGTYISTPTYTSWGFSGSTFLDSEGFIGTALVEMLRMCSALHASPDFPALPGFRFINTDVGGRMRSEHLQVSQYSKSHPHVLCVGELDVRALLWRLSSDGLDFEVPFALLAVEDLPAPTDAVKIAFGQIAKILMEHLAPALQGLRMLHDAGLTTLYLHSLPPPTLDSEKLSKLIGAQINTQVHYKLVMLANFIYREACADIGVGFIDTWPMVTDGNVRKAEYELDVVHLNRAHACLSVQEVHRQFTKTKA